MVLAEECSPACKQYPDCIDLFVEVRQKVDHVSVTFHVCKYATQCLQLWQGQSWQEMLYGINKKGSGVCCNEHHWKCIHVLKKSQQHVP